MDIKNITIGQTYMLAAKGTTPETTVRVVGVKGRWVRVAALFNGAEANVAAAQLSEIEPAAIEEVTTEAEVAEILEESREPSMISTLINYKEEAAQPESPYNLTRCPKCGSEELYTGRNVDGMIVDEGLVGGCHHCDWEWSVRNTRRNGIVKPEYLENYVDTYLTRDGENITSMDNNDAVAVTLRTIDTMDGLYDYVEAHLGLDGGELRLRYGHLNNGQQRMVLGNRLRAFLKKQASR